MDLQGELCKLQNERALMCSDHDDMCSTWSISRPTMWAPEDDAARSKVALHEGVQRFYEAPADAAALSEVALNEGRTIYEAHRLPGAPGFASITQEDLELEAIAEGWAQSA